MEQYIGDGANIFIIIVACLIGFGAALNLLDVKKTKKENEKREG
ncbi:MAG: hypothetical protein R3345_12940 [Fulvivirga sp.]|nr:hypothetical protein [Fulvivirga sp.]